MRQHLHEIHKALAEHERAHREYCKAQDGLHLVLDRCAKGIAQKAPGDSTITGHLGQMTKAINLHKSAHDVHHTADATLHTAVRKGIEGIAHPAGIQIGYTNPNVGTTTPSGEQDLSAPGEITQGVNPVAKSLRRGVTGKDLQKVMDVLQSRMPRFGKQACGQRTGTPPPVDAENLVIRKGSGYPSAYAALAVKIPSRMK